MSKKFKAVCVLVCTAALMLSMCLSSSAVFLEGADIYELSPDHFTEVPMYLNGEYIGEALKLSGTCYAPIPDFCEKLLGSECMLLWDSESAMLTMRFPDIDFSFNLVQDYMVVNGRYIYLPGIYNVAGTIYLPVRSLAKAFNAGVSWDDAEDESVSISYNPGDLIAPGSEFYSEQDVYWLSRVIYAESGNQPMLGMMGVGNVVLNRVRDDSGVFPDSIQGVIFQTGQFSVVETGAIYMEPKPHCVVAAKLCLEGYNSVGNSLFFLNPDISCSDWFDTYRSFYTSIGEHDFYA